MYAGKRPAYAAVSGKKKQAKGLSFQRTKPRGLNPTTRPLRPDGSTDLESRLTTSFLGRA